jgi:hypothetical protein
MPEWLQHAFAGEATLSPRMLLARLGAAFLLGLVVAGVYALTMRAPGRVSTRPFLATLVLLSLLIALVTMLIGDNQARAFSLVGVLAIVRFRTVVQDTRDTAFVIFAVVTGMAAGGGYLAAPLIGTPFILLGAWLFRTRRAPPHHREAALVLRLGAAHPPGDAVKQALERHLAGHRLTGLATARGGAALDMTYVVRTRSPEESLALVTELSRLEGVQGVELKEG